MIDEVQSMKSFKSMHKTALLIVIVCSMLLISFVTVPSLLTARAATMIEYAKPVTGQLTAGQKVEYTFNGKAGDKLTITMSATDGDGLNAYVSLYNPEGVLIGENDDGLGKSDAQISGIVLPVDGVYKIVAANIDGQAAGSYSLIVLRAIANKGVIYYDGSPDPNKEFYQLSRPLDTTNPTYYVANSLPGFNLNDVKAIIRQAFQVWADATPLTFTEVNDPNATFRIQFGQIDGQYQVLGEACPPSSPCRGDIQFDSDEPWILGAPQSDQDISFLAVASHEFGHAIGLLHSRDSSALMYYAYSPYNLKPNQDDIAGVQRLYGARGGGAVNSPTSIPGAPQNPQTGQSEVTGTIDRNEFIHFWDFDAQQGEPVTITMKRTSGNLDPFIVVIDQNNHILAYDDDSAGNRDAILQGLTFPQTGTYTVAATRAEQAQGRSTGNYNLSIQYGGTAGNNQPPANNPAPTQPNNNNGAAAGNGSVTVGSAQGVDLNDQNTPPLETALDTGFTESLTPTTQTRNAIVIREQQYTWSLTWCATDAATLQKNLNDMEVTFAVNGDAVNQNTVTRTPPHDINGLSCADFVVLLSNWTGSNMTLTRTLRMKNAVFDGKTIYGAGDYVDQINVSVR
jgi:hypothetical protein